MTRERGVSGGGKQLAQRRGLLTVSLAHLTRGVPERRQRVPPGFSLVETRITGIIADFHEVFPVSNVPFGPKSRLQYLPLPAGDRLGR